MTRKDYIKIAATLWHRQPSEIVWPGRFKDWQDLVGDFAQMLSEDNPRFDRDKFLAACYVGKGLR